MRFVAFSKVKDESQVSAPPTTEAMVEMGQYMEQVVKAGVLVAADGLQPTAKGAVIRFDGSDRTVIDGPFTETKEVIASFSILDVASKEEAIEWIKRSPNLPGGVGEVELRQLFEPEDFADVATDEVAAFDDNVGVLRRD
ncbi:YciI family protein [Cryptosporangium phraense]|uniref:YciI family protein n=1 Tax=Cryptosporangium phraense TaxID=2593070 RepID=A0A545B131_9ACTN|nr:YciI family protein [Cryptosporangium phraense]TQS46545.1 YciI family protein [Cryptosporangium phraense]